jgi:hypothetical protein
MIEVLKQMVEALEYHIEQTRPILKTKEAIQAGKQAIAELESQEPVAWIVWGENNVPALTFTKPADKYVFDSLYTYPPQRTEQNFCSRCGKRTADLTTIHTCTPPQENT